MDARQGSRARRGLLGRWRDRAAPGLDPSARAGAADGPSVAVVLLCEPADLPALPRGLASVLAQDHRPLQVLLCAVGPDAGRAEVTSRLADSVTSHEASAGHRDDPDLGLLLGPEGTTWTAAATSGLDAADADLVTLVRACDELPPGSLGRAAGLLGRTGAPLLLARVEQSGEPDPWFSAAQDRAHRDASAAGSIDIHCSRVEHGTLGGVVLRRDLLFSGGPLAGGVDPGDEGPGGFEQSVTLAGLLARLEPHAAFPTLDEPGYRLAPDHGRRAYGATPDPLPDLEAWHGRARTVVDRLAEREPPPDDGPDDGPHGMLAAEPLSAVAARGWAASGLPRLLVEAERATPEQWRRLVDLAREVPADVLPRVPAAARCLVHLAAADRRADVEALAADLERPDLRDTPPAVARGRELLAAWPSVADLPDLPDAARVLTRAETALRARAVRRHATGCEVLVGLRGLDLVADRAQVEATTLDGDALPVRVADSDEATRWAADPWCRGVVLEVDLPAADVEAPELAVQLAVTQDGVRRITTAYAAWPPRPRRSDLAAEVTVTDVEIEPDPDGDRIVLTGTGDLASLRLDGPEPTLAPLTTDTDGEVVLPLAAIRWGRARPVAPGSYRVVAGGPPAPLDDGLRRRLPLDLLAATHRVRVGLGARGGLVLTLTPPLDRDEAGPFAQRSLQKGYARAVVSSRPLDPSLVYAETYGGRTATDSPRAIVEALLHQRRDLRVRWGVADLAQSVPEGAEPVLLRSREHYDVLADARLLVLNTDVEHWFTRREGQFLLQCFHGYPAKAMGRSQWDALELRPARLRALRHRGVDSWSAILTPTPEMTAHYRAQYDYDGPAIEEGYPRDDDLTEPGSSAARYRRKRTRELLGLGDRVAVLYAPTWREELATRPRGAAMSDHLDVDRAARALGDSYALLLRGHRFHDPAASRSPLGSAPVIDVTDHPEINDLVLAADVAVLDYSSLRFDVALARRPTIFLVPDLDTYAAGTRRFLFPFESSAPGPLVSTTDEVVDLLRDVDGLRLATADDLDQFVARFHPFQDGRAAERVAARLLDLAAM